MSSLSPNPALESSALQGLNREQREAVLATEGPVLILAGAGTGKTRAIAHRIAHLLQVNPGISASNLLALTFSKKAAQEMLERVEGLLGTYADELGVFTFHGFCHRFLQDHAVVLGLPGHLKLLDRVESWIFFRKLLPELKLSHHWNVADPTDCIDGFLRFISRAKDELVDPEVYGRYVEQLADPKERARQKEVARVYRLYQKRLQETGSLDFGDLIGQTLKALQENPLLLEKLRARYRYILVDEFQDTNVAQIALLTLMSGAAGNLCVVGDDDQAIYRFRGASFASFSLMAEAFPKVRTLRLTQNYRSTPNILGVAERLIRHNEPDRYDVLKRLTTDNPSGAPVEARVCRDEVSEAQQVIEAIGDFLKGQPATRRGLHRIAVLYRAHAHRAHLVEALRQAGIPFAISQGEALFEQPEIEELIAFLKVVQDPADSVSLFRILSHPMWGIPPEDLIALNAHAKEQNQSLQKALSQVGSLEVGDQTKAAVGELLKQVRYIRADALRHGISEIVCRVVEKTALRSLFTLSHPAGTEGLLNLGRFLRFVYRYVRNHPEAQEVGSFLWYLASFIEAGGDFFEEEEGTPTDRVRLMTIHQAKGLEFDMVILLGLVQGRFPARARPEPIPFPVELMKEPLPQGDYHLQEERRLMFVACTRARQKLILLTQERAYHRSSVFVREMLENASSQEILRQETEASETPALPLKTRALLPQAVDGALWADRQMLQLLREIRTLEPQDQEGFSRRLEEMKALALLSWQTRQPPASAPPFKPELPAQLKLSFTQLETFRYCPLKYQYSYLYHIPVKPTPAMMFGIDLHECLEAFFQQVIEGRTLSLAQLLDSFRRLYTQGRYGEPGQDQDYARLGVELLTILFRTHVQEKAQPLFVEKPFLLQLGDVWIRGFVDRVDSLPGGGVEIIDYKTGRPKKDATSEEQLQLRLYALAAQEVFHLAATKISFYYLRDNSKLSFEHDPADVEKTRHDLQELVSQMKSSDFSPTPSVMKCRWCDFRTLCPASMAKTS